MLTLLVLMLEIFGRIRSWWKSKDVITIDDSKSLTQSYIWVKSSTGKRYLVKVES